MSAADEIDCPRSVEQLHELAGLAQSLGEQARLGEGLGRLRGRPALALHERGVQAQEGVEAAAVPVEARWQALDELESPAQLVLRLLLGQAGGGRLGRPQERRDGSLGAGGRHRGVQV